MTTSTGNSFRYMLLFVMDLLVILALLLLARLVIEFFGSIAAQEVPAKLLELTDPLVFKFGVDPVNTPYGGHFNIDATITVILMLGAEWAVGVVRRES